MNDTRDLSLERYGRISFKMYLTGYGVGTRCLLARVDLIRHFPLYVFTRRRTVFAVTINKALGYKVYE